MRTATAIQYADLLEVRKYGERRACAVAVTQSLKVRILAVVQIDAGLFGFDVKTYIAEIWCKVEGVIGPLLRTSIVDDETGFNLNFLLVGVVLVLVINVPSERFEQRVNEVFANFGFLIGWL